MLLKKILNFNGINNVCEIATTIDDSFGESFDKVAKMLKLGYPGGPIVEKLAKDGNEDRFNFTIPLQNSPLIAFSYSGLKNAVRLAVLEEEKKEEIIEEWVVQHVIFCTVMMDFMKEEIPLYQKINQVIC